MAAGAGLAEGRVVYLHPERFAPRTPDGRGLLAHELTHVAQRAVPAAPGPVHAAEAEAAALAKAFSTGLAVAPPAVALQPHAIAAENGPTAAPAALRPALTAFEGSTTRPRRPTAGSRRGPRSRTPTAPGA